MINEDTFEVELSLRAEVKELKRALRIEQSRSKELQEQVREALRCSSETTRAAERFRRLEQANNNPDGQMWCYSVRKYGLFVRWLAFAEPLADLADKLPEVKT